jgi:hypothetical protein
MVRAASCLTIVSISSALMACHAEPESALPRGAPVPAAAPPVSAPPTPAPSDWKGLFDSDSEPNDVPPNSDSVKAVLAREPSCSRALTVAPGAFTGAGRDEQAYLLACGAKQRVVIATESATVASLDVSEDTLIAAGDMDWDGNGELLLIGHAGPRTTVRVLRADGAKLSPVYTFTVALEPCAHTIIYYRFVKPSLDFREDKLPKRCTP